MCVGLLDMLEVSKKRRGWQNSPWSVFQSFRALMVKVFQDGTDTASMMQHAWHRVVWAVSGLLDMLEVLNQQRGWQNSPWSVFQSFRALMVKVFQDGTDTASMTQLSWSRGQSFRSWAASVEKSSFARVTCSCLEFGLVSLCFLGFTGDSQIWQLWQVVCRFGRQILSAQCFLGSRLKKGTHTVWASELVMPNEIRKAKGLHKGIKYCSATVRFESLRCF